MYHKGCLQSNSSQTDVIYQPLSKEPMQREKPKKKREGESREENKEEQRH